MHKSTQYRNVKSLGSGGNGDVFLNFFQLKNNELV